MKEDNTKEDIQLKQILTLIQQSLLAALPKAEVEKVIAICQLIYRSQEDEQLNEIILAITKKVGVLNSLYNLYKTKSMAAFYSTIEKNNDLLLSSVVEDSNPNVNEKLSISSIITAQDYIANFFRGNKNYNEIINIEKNITLQTKEVMSFFDKDEIDNFFNFVLTAINHVNNIETNILPIVDSTSISKIILCEFINDTVEIMGQMINQLKKNERIIIDDEELCESIESILNKTKEAASLLLNKDKLINKFIDKKDISRFEVLNETLQAISATLSQKKDTTRIFNIDASHVEFRPDWYSFFQFNGINGNEKTNAQIYTQSNKR